MNSSALRKVIEAQIPSAFSLPRRAEGRFFPTGLTAIDRLTGGVPVGALTEICGSAVASSGKTSLVVSLLAHARQFCALVDANDAFDPASAAAAGVNLSRMLWVRCGKTRQKLRPLEQAFKAADVLLQSGGFGLIVLDISGIPESVVRKIPLTSWFRLSRVVEKMPTALVFIEQQPHAASCAGLVLNLLNKPPVWSGNLLTRCSMEVEVIRGAEKKRAHSANPVVSLRAQWA